MFDGGAIFRRGNGERAEGLEFGVEFPDVDRDKADFLSRFLESDGKRVVDL